MHINTHTLEKKEFCTKDDTHTNKHKLAEKKLKRNKMSILSNGWQTLIFNIYYFFTNCSYYCRS